MISDASPCFAGLPSDPLLDQKHSAGTRGVKKVLSVLEGVGKGEILSVCRWACGS